MAVGRGGGSGRACCPAGKPARKFVELIWAGCGQTRGDTKVLLGTTDPAWRCTNKGGASNLPSRIPAFRDPVEIRRTNFDRDRRCRAAAAEMASPSCGIFSSPQQWHDRRLIIEG